MGEQRAEANRLNAQRSSGPRTELGKSRSKMNALKHGLSAKKIVIGDEDPKEFEALRAALERDWQLETAFESELVDQLAGLFWRMRRVPAIEAAIVKAREAKADVYSDVEKNKWDRIKHEAELIKHDVDSGTYTATLDQFRNQVIEEEEKKEGLDASISKRAEEHLEKRESELLLLIRDDDGMIEKLSRYHASLINAANRVIQQLRLSKIMRSSRSLIAFE